MSKKPPRTVSDDFGWAEFLTGKLEMLAAYDIAKVRTREREFKDHHGRVAEASFRRWLQNFLPARYGVTSGYIVSQRKLQGALHRNYDVVIYDKVESPTLWIEDNTDQSEQGVFRAIPAEHVLAVYEVKARFNKTMADQAVEKLFELKPFLVGQDPEEERYPCYLPRDFHCGLVFFELLKTDLPTAGSLFKMTELEKLRGYMGGVILRGEDEAPESTGTIGLLQADAPIDQMVPDDNKDTLNQYSSSKEYPIKNEDCSVYLSTSLLWNQWYFANFAHAMLNALRGRRSLGLPSFHGINVG